MKLKERPAPPTLAQKSSEAALVSGFAIRLARVNGVGEGLTDGPWKVAVERGARRNQRNLDPTLLRANLTSRHVSLANL